MRGVRVISFALRRRLLWVVLLTLFSASVRAQVQQTLLLPSDVAYDAAGNLFFTDTNRNQVFEVSLAGVVSVFAGTGVQGFAGDGGAAIAAQLNAPQGIAVGADGTIYVADTGNQRIRSIANGQIATLAGSGVKGFAGDGGAATAANFSAPSAIAVDASGALLICDSGNQRVRRVASGTIATIAGNGGEGFAGDGSAATAAELDTPAGVAVAADGRILIADSHNHRLRVIATDGTIQTFAGTGVRGFAGDGGAATQAALFLPRGVAVASDGSVLFADSDNQRVRRIDANGNVATIAGSGVQGVAADGTTATTAALDTPRGVALSSFGAPTVADSHNAMVREVAASGELYTIALPPPRTSSVTFQTPSTAVYGQGAGQVQVVGSVPVPQGAVMLLDAGTQVASVGFANLSEGKASVAFGLLSAGKHSLSVAYAGDGLNPAATSAVSPVSVTPANAVATANAASVAYGAAIPALTGTVSGILPQDATLAAASFTTAAVPLNPVGSYPIFATLNGSAAANYSLTLNPASGAFTIVQAASTSALASPNQNSYAGLPLLLTATVASTTSGTPTGQVNFLDGTTVIVAGVVSSNGIASGTYLSPSAGSHTLAVTYSGDGNFLGSASTPLAVTIGGMPDFTLTSPSPTQTVQGGLIAGYAFNVASENLPFTGVVTFSVAGLPTGANATFSPTQVVPGSVGATVTMNVQTVALGEVEMPRWMLGGGSLLAMCVPLLLCGKRKQSLPVHVCLGVLLLAATALIEGCGARTISAASQASQTATLTVTGTSTDLAGAIVTHTAAVTLTVE